MSDLLTQHKPEFSMGHGERVAWRKAGSIPSWEVCKWEVVEPNSQLRDIIMEGGVPRLLKSGKHKGKKTWRDSVLTRVVVTGVEIEAEKSEYSNATGNCARCMGSGKTIASWSSIEGTKYHPCSMCNGTGKAQAVA